MRMICIYKSPVMSVVNCRRRARSSGPGRVPEASGLQEIQDRPHGLRRSHEDAVRATHLHPVGGARKPCLVDPPDRVFVVLEKRVVAAAAAARCNDAEGHVRGGQGAGVAGRRAEQAAPLSMPDRSNKKTNPASRTYRNARPYPEKTNFLISGNRLSNCE